MLITYIFSTADRLQSRVRSAEGGSEKSDFQSQVRSAEGGPEKSDFQSRVRSVEGEAKGVISKADVCGTGSERENPCEVPILVSGTILGDRSLRIRAMIGDSMTGEGRRGA